MSTTKVIIGVLIFLFILGIGWWIKNEMTPKVMVGEKITDLGRGHAPIGTEVKYNSNPPTSGPHYEDWVKAGVYSEVKDDRNLVHSLEHGYIVISYNCSFKKSSSLVQTVYAHGIEEEGSSTPQATISATLSEDFRSGECHKLVDNLISVYEAKGKRKLVIVPRPSLDAKIALTAWDYLDKFNDFDKNRIERFIDSHFDLGPERTME